MIDSQYIKELARGAGFSDCGIARAEALTEDEFPLGEWLDRGFQADMHYMERNAAMRRDPRILVDGARSVISLVVPYKSDRLVACGDATPLVAQYAYGEDYHERLKRMMYQLIAGLKGRYADFEGRPFVDTAPISDRHWAVRAGLGWIGKNTLFYHKRYGSLCYLCEVVSSSECDVYDDEERDCAHNCDGCAKCVAACPNHAIVPLAGGKPGRTVIDARRCTSYNTIENRNVQLPEELDTRGYVFGCDICQTVCPYNQKTEPVSILSDEQKGQLESLPSADQAAFGRMAKHSALSRMKYSQLRRNVEKAFK